MCDTNISDRYLQPIEVINFFVNETSPQFRATNFELVTYFRPLLVSTSSCFGPENHVFLKQITGRLAVVKKLKGAKYLELKHEFRGKDPHTIFRIINTDIGPSRNDHCLTSYENSLSMQNENENSLKEHEHLSQELNQKPLHEATSKDKEESNCVIQKQGNLINPSSNRVRFTEDTARSRAPLSLTLRNEIEDIFQSENMDIQNMALLENNGAENLQASEEIPLTPPLPPHCPQTSRSYRSQQQ